MFLCNPNQYLTSVVLPSLKHVGCTELNLGVLIATIPFALQHEAQTQANHFGPYLMSQAQHWATWDNYLALNPDLASRVRGLASQRRFTQDPDLELNLNSGYASAIAAAFLMSQLGNLSLQDDVLELGARWQQITEQPLSMTMFMSLYPSLKNQWAALAA